MRYLLDTNVVSDLMRNPRGRAAHRIATIGEKLVCTSIIVAAELRYGVFRKGSKRLASRLELVLGALEILPLEVPVDTCYGALRADLERIGQLIGPNDLLIAAQALVLGHAIVTDNDREFARIKGLRIENWLR